MENPYAPPSDGPESAAEPEANAARRIGGWLILPLLGMLFNAVSLSLALFGTYLPMFGEGGSWEILNDESSPDYHPLWAPLIVFEIFWHVGYIALIAYALFLALRRVKRFVPVAVGYYLGAVILVIIDHAWASAIPALAATPDAQSIGNISRAMFPAMIWVPYFLLSKRVKETFVNP